MALRVVDRDVSRNEELGHALFLEVLNEDQAENQNSVHRRMDRSVTPFLADLNSTHTPDDQARALDHHTSHHAEVVIPYTDHLVEVAVHRVDVVETDAAAERCQRSIHHNSLTPILLRWFKKSIHQSIPLLLSVCTTVSQILSAVLGELSLLQSKIR